MEKKSILKSIEVHAAKDKVWEVLFNDRYTIIWYAEFSQGTYAETDWKVGSKALFKDGSGSGLAGKIILNNPSEALTIEHQGIVIDGKEDYESELAKQVKGSLESYILNERENITILSVQCDTTEEYFEDMSFMWDKALRKVKDLSEASGAIQATKDN